MMIGSMGQQCNNKQNDNNGKLKVNNIITSYFNGF